MLLKKWLREIIILIYIKQLANLITALNYVIALNKLNNYKFF